MSVLTIREMLLEKERNLKKLIQMAESSANEKEFGSLRITSFKEYSRFYRRFSDENGKKHDQYLSKKKDAEQIKNLAQNDYTNIFLRTAYEQLRAVQKALKNLMKMHWRMCSHAFIRTERNWSAHLSLIRKNYCVSGMRWSILQGIFLKKHRKSIQNAARE